jgi:hypothetical protein
MLADIPDKSSEEGQTYKFSHSALAHCWLISTVDLGDVVALDLCNVLVHGQVPGWRVSVDGFGVVYLGVLYRKAPSGRISDCRARLLDRQDRTMVRRVSRVEWQKRGRLSLR